MLNHVVAGSGSPLLILHGSRLDHRHMMETLEPIFEEIDGWKRVYVDLPGMVKAQHKMEYEHRMIFWLP